MGRRRAQIAIPFTLAALSMIGPFSIDTAFPAFGDIQQAFGVGVEGTQLLVSAYLLPFALMSVFHGPLSDALGRRPVIVGGVALYALASVGCALAPNFTTLVIFRIVQGLVAGGSVIVSRTVIRDMYSGAEAQRLMSRVVMIFGLAPAIAPIAGGALLQVGTWRIIFWSLAAMAALLVVMVIIVLPETHPADRRTPFAPGAMVRGLGDVWRSGPFQRVAWSSAFSFGAQFIYIGSAAIFVVDLLHRGETDFWLLFVPLISGVIIGSWVSGRLAGRVSGPRLVRAGYAISMAAGLVNIALVSVFGAQLPYAVIGPALIAFGMAVAYPTLQLAGMDLFPHNRGAAASLLSVISLGLGSLTAGALAPTMTTSLVTLAVWAFAFSVIGSLIWVWHVRVDHPRATPAQRGGERGAADEVDPIDPTEAVG